MHIFINNRRNEIPVQLLQMLRLILDYVLICVFKNIIQKKIMIIFLSIYDANHEKFVTMILNVN